MFWSFGQISALPYTIMVNNQLNNRKQPIKPLFVWDPTSLNRNIKNNLRNSY